MFVYLSEQNMPYLPLIISIKLIGFLIILAIAKNNKKKIGAISAVAEHLNSILEKDQAKWNGLFEDNFFIIKREFYHEKIEKKLSSKLFTYNNNS